MQKVSKDIIKIAGILDFINHETLVQKLEDSLQVIDAANLSVIHKVAIESDFIAPLHYDDQGAIYQDIDFDGSDVFYWDFQSENFTKVSHVEGDGLMPFYEDDRVQLLVDASSGWVYSREQGSFSFKELYQVRFPSNKPLVGDGLITHIGLGGDMKCVNFRGEAVWESTFSRVCPQLTDHSSTKRPSIKPPAHLVDDNIIFHQYPYRLVCISLADGSYKWSTDDVVDFNWCTDGSGKIYCIRQGLLKILSTHDGSILSEKRIECDWIQREKDALNLFQVEATKTHLICGFLSHGLCAINLEFATVDWQEFEGMTCNRKPIIRNHNIYAQMKGGIELQSGDVQEYILSLS